MFQFLKKWIVHPESVNELKDIDPGTFPAAKATHFSDASFSLRILSISSGIVDADNV